jgi:YD repeat-containing protein
VFVKQTLTCRRACRARPATSGSAACSASPQRRSRQAQPSPNNARAFRIRLGEHGSAGGRASAGRELLFDSRGKLLQISAPTGEFVTLRHDAQGWLVEVTDPQGRSLHLNYLDQAMARADRGHDQRFRGVQSIDSPVGRYAYAYNDRGAQTPAAVKAALQTPANGRPIEPAQLLANLVKVSLPTHYDAEQKAHPYANRGVSSSSIARLYHYEDPRQPTLLTGITVSGQGSDGRQMLQRINTWAYDAYGRANLSVRGEPARLETDAAGKPLEPRRLAAGTGLEQVTLTWPRAGEVVLTNALGQETIYRTDRVGGQYRIVEVRGAGCVSCGATNVRYEHDKQGRQVEETRLDASGQPIEGWRTERDAQGRAVRVSRIAYREGKAQPPQWAARYEYAASVAGTMASAGAADADNAASAEPVLISRPSVVDGREHQVRITYNEAGQPTSVAESGFSPVDERGEPARSGTPLARTTTYGYRRINGRSVLAQIDEPLANGSTASPQDSDVTRYEWDARGERIVAIAYPAGLAARFEHDEVGRVTRATGVDSVVTRYAYDVAAINRPSLIERAGHNVRYGFDAQGRISAVADTPGRSITLRYDAADHVVSVVDAQGYKAETVLDPEGQPRMAGLYEPEQAQPLRATYRWFDAQRRLIKQLRADGRFDTWRYDPEGRIVEHLDGDDVLHLAGHNDARGAQVQLDIAPDRLMRARFVSPGIGSDLGRRGHGLPGEQTLGSTLEQTGVPAGEAAASPADPSRQRDDFGRTVLAWLPGQGARAWTHDAADHPILEQRFDRKTQVASTTRSAYDPAGRLTERTTLEANADAASPLQTLGALLVGLPKAKTVEDFEALLPRQIKNE